MAYVYSHTRLDNGIVFYIGIGSTPNHQRAYIRSNRSSHWKRVVNLAGYSVQILFDNLTWEEAQEREIEQISLYGRADLKKGTLINLTDGGDGTLGCKRTDEWKLMMKDKMTGRTITDPQRERMSNARKGRKFSPLTQEHKDKISTGNMGKKMSADSLEKMRRSKIGKKLTDAHKKLISERGKGRKATPEALRNMIAGQKRLSESGNRTPMSEANKKMLSEKNRQYKHTAEAIERIRAAVTERRRKDREKKAILVIKGQIVMRF